jgi:RNA polymerase sigma factor (sigma-70 family)
MAKRIPFTGNVPAAAATDAAGKGSDRNPPMTAAIAGPITVDPREALKEHGPWLRAVAIARLKSVEGADDVMQDVAIAAVRNWQTLRDFANARPWLYRLTVRAALMHRRTLGRARKRVHEAVDLYRAAHGAVSISAEVNPLDRLLSSERFVTLRKAMDRLPAKDREMLLMKHVDDCSYQEIAQRLGVTVGVVQMRLFRARQKVREWIEAADRADEMPPRKDGA